ncbi:MAG: hypothetical protein LBD10_13795 [Desulfobulbus sp.]|jgi:hypothetical protein|uniref:hypothetical protein n=1 Tax=Desulfobulbus sp. TaxID=895 RepID=UPI00284141F4|nr:hypothetical protein [Desulfobulbus sp.]MDR2551263.1 hypothetical protein [Desulfobulbus sp.]
MRIDVPWNNATKTIFYLARPHPGTATHQVETAFTEQETVYSGCRIFCGLIGGPCTSKQSIPHLRPAGSPLVPFQARTNADTAEHIQ